MHTPAQHCASNSPLVGFIVGPFPVGRIVWEGLGGVPLGTGFEVSKAQVIPVSALCLMPVDLDVSSWLLLQHRVCLSAAMFSAAVMVMGSNISEPRAPN